MGVFNRTIFNNTVFNVGADEPPPPSGRPIRRGRVTVDVTWSLEDDDAEIVEILGVLLGADDA